MALSIVYYFYYFPAILVGFFPWAVFLGPATVETVRRLRHRDASYDGCVLATCWFGTWFVLWSLVKTKLPHYLLPAYPALALLTAFFIDRWQELGVGESGKLAASPFPQPFPQRWLQHAWLSLVLVGIGMMIAVPIVSLFFLPGEAVLGLVWLIPAIGGGWCWWQTAHDRHQQAFMAFTVTAVLFLTAIFGFAALRVDHHQNARPMIAAIRADYERPGMASGKRKEIEVDPPFAAEKGHQLPCPAHCHLWLLPRKHRVLCRTSGHDVRRQLASGSVGPAGVAGIPGEGEPLVRHYHGRIHGRDRQEFSRPLSGDFPAALLSAADGDGGAAGGNKEERTW